MKLILFLVIIVMAFIRDFLIKKHLRLATVLITMSRVTFVALIEIFLICILFFSKISSVLFINLKIYLFLFGLVVGILIFILMKNNIALTTKILDFYINEKKLLKTGHIEMGTIHQIKSYGFSRGTKAGFYLIVDCNGEKIMSVPFKFLGKDAVLKTTYNLCYNGNKHNKEKIGEVFASCSSLYNVGDNIEVIVYNNRKYVKLKE